MKAAVQLAAILAAFAGLVGSLAANATDVASLPLKMSVLAKPNVIFGLDDSGSMDSEVMLNTNDGALWWDHTAASGWSAAGVPWFNTVGSASTQWRKLVYLFPNGLGAATGDRTYGDADTDHFAAPPTPQFAWLRSAAYNPLYFDPAATYTPWSPAYVSGALRSYANSPPAAARSHPVVGSGTFDLRVDRALTTTANHTFIGLPGMVVPAGARTCPHPACGSWTTEASTRTVPANTVLRVAMAYFPATYWQREACPVNGTDCVAAPNGATLKRYEIKAANYATTAAHTAALQNFANWFTYYRKRKLMLNAAIGQVLEPLTGLRMGVVRFNSHGAVTMYDADNASAASNALRVAGTFYETNGTGGTPTRQTLKYIGEQYRSNAALVQYACQRNNAFIVTDGFALADEEAATQPPTYAQGTWGSGAPYATTTAYSLADIALGYYTLNLRPAPAMAVGRVPLSATDRNPNLHMNTYGLTLGARGTLYNGEGTALPTSPSAWPVPNVDRSPTSVDDLWHATINGRGRMFLATTPAETAVRIQIGLTDMLSQTGAQSGISVSTVNLVRGDGRGYFGAYNPAGWAGDLSARLVDSATGNVATEAEWSASALLGARTWTSRVIASGGAAFTAAGVGATVNPSAAYGVTEKVINYLRGDRSGEGTAFRLRTSLMGAVINSEPLFSRDDGVVYVASGEGMLHAFDTRAPNAGRELWAYVPRFVLPTIGETATRGYAFQTQLDGSPVIGRIASNRQLLVAGGGAAARAYFALDVTSPRDLDEAGLAARHKWEFPAAGNAALQAKVGQALGRPVIARSLNDGHVVLVTSGYNSTSDGRGRVWMLNADTGAVIHEFSTGVGTLANEAGLAHLVGFAEPDGTVRYAYGGDLLGNVWRFDLQDKGAPVKIAQLRGPAPGSDVQPVTAAPEILSTAGKRVIVVGTGRLLDASDFGNTRVQSIYAIADGTLLADARAGLVRQTYTSATNSITNAAVDFRTGRGWYIDLPAGEQLNTRPSIAYGALAFVSNTTGSTDCSASSKMYLVKVLSGSAMAGAPVMSVISASANSSGVTALLTSTQRIVGAGQSADGQPWNREIAAAIPIDPSKNAWREVRR